MDDVEPRKRFARSWYPSEKYNGVSLGGARSVDNLEDGICNLVKIFGARDRNFTNTMTRKERSGGFDEIRSN